MGSLDEKGTRTWPFPGPIRHIAAGYRINTRKAWGKIRSILKSGVRKSVVGKKERYLVPGLLAPSGSLVIQKDLAIGII